jgi:hypothetical protein
VPTLSTRVELHDKETKHMLRSTLDCIRPTDSITALIYLHMFDSVCESNIESYEQELEAKNQLTTSTHSLFLSRKPLDWNKHLVGLLRIRNN